MKRKIIITSFTLAFLLLFGGVVYSYNTPEHRLERQLKLGNKYLLEAKYEEAIIAFTKAISIEPKTINGRLGLATAYIHTKKLDSAEKVLKEVLEVEAKNIEAREYLVNIYVEQTKLEEAEEFLKQIVGIDPSKNESVLVDAVNELKEVKLSEENYNTALKLMKDKKYIEAINFFNKIIPKDINRYSDAQSKAIECKSIYINDNMQTAKQEAKNQNFKVAISYLDLILKLEPTNSEALKLKADYSESIKKQEEEKKRLEEKRRQEELKKQEANRLITEEQAKEIAIKDYKKEYGDRYENIPYTKVTIYSEGLKKMNGKSYYDIRIYLTDFTHTEALGYYYIEQNGGKAYALDEYSHEYFPLD